MAEHLSFLATPKPRSTEADEKSEQGRPIQDHLRQTKQLSNNKDVQVGPQETCCIESPTTAIDVLASEKRLLATVAIVGKGGGGKTSICTNLATIAQGNGYRVKIVDAGLQKSALAWQMIRGRNDISVECCQFSKLRTAIEAASHDGTEVLLIDMPPGLAPARAAARLANLVLIAGRPLFFDVAVVNELSHLLTTSKVLFGVVINDAPRRRGKQDARAVRETRQVLAHIGDALWSGQITHRLAVPFAGMRGMAAFEVKPTSPAASEYNHLWQVIAQTLL
jgi:chromosome partitioning protein